MNQKISVEYQLEKKDFVDFNVARRLQNAMSYIIYALFVAAIVFQIVNGANKIFTVAYIIFFAIYIVYPYFNAGQIFKAMPKNYAKLNIEIDENGFLIKDANSEIQKAWSEVILWREYRKFFAIFVSKTAVTIIPKRALNSDQSEGISSIFNNLDAQAKAQTSKN